MATDKAVDDLLDQMEKTLLKVQDSQGSQVKLNRFETDLLSLIEKARDMMMACVQDKDDRDRKKMMGLFGGDCVRVSRMRAYLEAVKLSPKSAADQRPTMCVSTIDMIERVLTEKGHGEALRSAQRQCIPWCPRPLKAGGADEAPAAPAPAPAPKPAPKPEPAPKAPEPAPKAPAPEEKSAPATTQNVVTEKGGGYVEKAPEPKRMVMVTITTELNPTFDFGPGGTMVMELPGITVKMNTTCTPPLPSGAKPFEADQEFVITVPEVAKVVFDPKNPSATPGAKVQAAAVGFGKVMIIPEDIDVGVQNQTIAPWGFQKLMEGSKETELHYEVEVVSKFGQAEQDDYSTELTNDLQVIFTAYLTGAGSAKFQPDGKPVAAPVRG